MAKRKRSKKSREELSDENEFLKMKMMAEIGGNFEATEKIPPEVENIFLKQIISFHKKHDKSKVTTIHKFVGEPEYNHVNDLSDKEVKTELKRLLRLMRKNGVVLNVLAPTPDREVYRFVTKEFFKHKIDDVKASGWTSQFIYEDFYPNAEYDVKVAVHEVLRFIFDSKALWMQEYFAEDMKDSIGLSLDLEEFHDRVKNFQSPFADVLLIHYDIISAEIDVEQGTAHVICDVTYKTQREKGKRGKREVTSVEVFVKRDEKLGNWWQVERVATELF